MFRQEYASYTLMGIPYTNSSWGVFCTIGESMLSLSLMNARPAGYFWRCSIRTGPGVTLYHLSPRRASANEAVMGGGAA
jgi:hypothetical protein